MSRPWGSATAADLENARGSEPIRVTLSRGCGLPAVVVVPTLPPQPATRAARARSPASAGLGTQRDPAEDAGSRLVRRPARLYRSLLAVREPAASAEALAPDVRDTPTADVAARQILELQRGLLEGSRSDEQVGTDQELLRTRGLPDERDDLLRLRPVANHAAGEALVHVRSVPQRGRVAERADDQKRQSDDGHGSGRRNARDPPRAAEAPDEQSDDARDRKSIEDRQPRCATVGPRHQSVYRGETPDGEVEVVRLAPEAVGQSLPIVVRDRERHQQLG